jgi:hypothetical protein
MPALPRSDASLLVRTDFTSDDAWQQVSGEAQRENKDGFRAYLEPVSGPAFDRARWEEVKAAVPAGGREAMVLFVADSTALAAPDNPVLVVDLLYGRPPFRAIVSELWAIENNLNIANMDWKSSPKPQVTMASSGASAGAASTVSGNLALPCNGM